VLTPPKYTVNTVDPANPAGGVSSRLTIRGTKEYPWASLYDLDTNTTPLVGYSQGYHLIQAGRTKFKGVLQLLSIPPGVVLSIDISDV
jgi:hypothetical protein